MICDVVCDLAFGDSGKGKITHHLLKSGEYTHCVRWSGGANAGHTIYHEGQKIITHLIPAGVFFGIPSIIGPGCVVNPEAFLEEMEYLEGFGIPARQWVKIAKNAHIVTAEHLEEDGRDTTIGTTKRGIGPAFRDKYARTGKRVEECPELAEFTIDMYKDFLGKDEYGNEKDIVALLEGAQGFGLDPIWGDYPYVTSSHCITAGALLNGFPPQSVRKVYGVAKAYETYVGQKEFEGDDPIFEKMREIGGEYGATTGRPRQCNYFNVDLFERACRINGVTHVVINKMDILQKLNCWCVRNDGGDVYDLETEERFKSFISNTVFPKPFRGSDTRVIFSYGPEGI